MDIKKVDLINSMQNNKFKVIILTFFGALFFVSVLALIAFFLCTFEIGATCYDADDFGFPKHDISSKPEMLSSTNTSDVAKWLSTGLQATGDIVAIKVKNRPPVEDEDYFQSQSAWRPWGFQTTIPSECEYDLDTCRNESDKNDSCKCRDESDKNYPCTVAPIKYPHCYLTKGIGLYALVTNPNLNFKPNDNLAYSRDPNIIGALTFHLGEGHIGRNTENGYYDDDYESVGSNEDVKSAEENSNHDHSKIGGYVGPLPSNSQNSTTSYKGGNLHFKIFDSIYKDNLQDYKKHRQYINEDGEEQFEEGFPPDIGYSIVIKSGFKEKGEGIFGTLINFVKEKLKGASEQIFKGLVENIGFNFYIQILLIIYVTVFGLAYLSGFVNMVKSEALIRAIKISIVASFMSSDSWEFFNEHLFTMFIDGVDSLLEVMFKGLLGQESSTNLIDNVFGLVTSKELHYKIIATIFSFPTGFIFAIFFYVGMFFFITSCIGAAILYCLSLIAISILIILAPIFIPFMLFKATKPLTESWFKQLLSYFIQPLLVLAFLGFMSVISMQQIQNLLGLPICNQVIADFAGLFELRIFKFKYIPEDLKDGKQKDILVPGVNFVNDLTPQTKNNNHVKSEHRELCQPYECYDYRFPAAPFLQPTDPNDENNKRDQELIDDIRDGTHLDFIRIMTFALIMVLTFNFTGLVPVLARGLAGAQMSLAHLEEASYAAYNALKDGFTETLSMSSRLMTGTDYVNETRRLVQATKHKWQDTARTATSKVLKAPGQFLMQNTVGRLTHKLDKMGKFKRAALSILIAPIGITYAFGKYQEVRERFKDNARIGRHWRHQKLDKIGARSDNIKMYRDHLGNSLSGGFSGANMYDPGIITDSNGKKTYMRDPNGKLVTRADLVANQFATVYNDVDNPLYGMNAFIGRNSKGKLERDKVIYKDSVQLQGHGKGGTSYYSTSNKFMTSKQAQKHVHAFSGALQSTSRYAKITTGIMILNPVLGVAVGTAGTVFAAYKIAQGFSNISKNKAAMRRAGAGGQHSQS